MTNSYLEYKELSVNLKVPLEAKFDITYRCNNNCLHCWLRIPQNSPRKREELTLTEIKKLVNDARRLGCRRWSISGGEPMLREDFFEIFDYLTANSISYSINTNGTFITPKIARLMKRKGNKMVVLYGATAEVHDRITRNPGSFEQAMRGFRYLKEAGVGFTVQLIPMKDNYHQLKEMVLLAESLSKNHRIGAAWLYLSADGDKARNQEIAAQRLPPKEVIELDKPDLSYEYNDEKNIPPACSDNKDADYLFSSCIASRQDFHLDPYGKMTFCCFVKDPSFRYDLKKGTLQDGWDNFIPSLAKKVKADANYHKNCGSCELKADCRWCPVYSYLEHRNFTDKIDYLCKAALENRKFKKEWKKMHRKYYKIADITLQVDADLPITDNTFHSKFKFFEVDEPGGDVVSIRHHFSLPEMDNKSLGKEVYRRAPWAIYKKDNSWIYLGISPQADDPSLHRVAVFNQDHSSARIYNDREDIFKKGDLHSLTLFPTDQILLARILADREGFFLHSCGIDFGGRGLLFAGHSEAGKSTTSLMLKEAGGEILCDDRIIVRKNGSGFKIHGTWSHGDVPDVSGKGIKLSGIFFLEKASVNKLIPLKDKKEISRRLLEVLIKPFVTTDWWQKTLVVMDEMIEKVPFYIMRFDKSGKIVDELKKLQE